MLRWKTLIAPVAALALVVAFNQTQLRADDAATPTGKATVTVTVVDSAGKPVAGATVSIFPSKAKGKKKGGATPDAGATSQPTDGAKPARPTPLVTGETGADGTVALAKVPDGDFRVTARLKGSGNGQATVTVADDKDQTVSVTLKPRAAKN